MTSLCLTFNVCRSSLMPSWQEERFLTPLSCKYSNPNFTAMLGNWQGRGWGKLCNAPSPPSERKGRNAPDILL